MTLAPPSLEAAAVPLETDALGVAVAATTVPSAAAVAVATTAGSVAATGVEESAATPPIRRDCPRSSGVAGSTGKGKEAERSGQNRDELVERKGKRAH